MMKKFLTLAFAATIICNSYAKAAEDKLLARYKGGEVKLSQVMDQFKAAFENPNLKGKSFNELDSKMQESLVKGYVNIKLIEQEIKNRKIEDSKEFKDKLDAISKQIATNELLTKISEEKVTDKLVEDEYNRIMKELENQEEIKVRHILVKTKKEANEIRQRLAKGEKLKDLAKKLSEDQNSKSKGGELGYFSQGQIDPDFEEKAFSLKKGEISAPVKTAFGWHIIQLEDRRKVKLPSKEEGMNFARARVRDAAIQKYLEELSSQADIKLFLDTADDKNQPADTKK